MYTQSPVSPASLVPNDPLVHILGCVFASDALERLERAHKSPDTRAVLRLIAPLFMNVLGTASVAAQTISLQSVDGAWGTALVRTIVERTLEGSDAAAAMLADLVDNVDAAACVTRRVLPQQIADNILLSRVKTQNAKLDDFARLLATLNEHPVADEEGGWIRELLVATAEAVANIPIGTNDHEHNSTQVLCLFSLLLIMYGDEAVRVLNAMDSTRKLVRHVINMLSRPSPLIAAPALHVLSRILLHPHDSTDPLLQQHTTLSILAVSPGRKLFDGTHMSRTLVLAADMCLNCVAADTNTRSATDAQTELVASDLRVLDAVAGVVQACASAQSKEARNWFFQSTAMIPAILHLVSMSELDRRYLNPLLCIVNSILSLSEANSPLVAALVEPSQHSQHESAPNSPQTKPDELSIIDKIVELVISSIEDVADTVPRFTLPPIGLGSPGVEAVTSSNSLDVSWPRVSSDESGCGWFVNCTQKQRRSVLLFLQHALQADQDQYWVRELFVTVTQIIGDFVHIAKSSEADPADPFGVTRATAVDIVKARARAEQQMQAIGSYYWTIKPILAFVADLIGVSSSVAAYWREQMCSNGMAGILPWAEHTCQHATSNLDVPLDRALYNDVCDILASLSSSKYSEPQQISRSVRPSVATPSDSSSSSSSSSSTASPRLDRSDIAIDDLRAASFHSGLGVTTTDEKPSCGANAAGLIQAAVICYWARTCQLELAMLVLRCNYTSSNDVNGIKQLTCLQEFVQESRDFVAPPLMQHTCPFLASLVFASNMQRRSQQEHTAEQTALLQRCKEQADRLVDLEEDSARMQDELRLQKTHVSQQSAQYTQQQEEIRALEMAKRELEASASEHQKQRQQMETDVSEWKEECIRTRDDLEQTGVLLTTAREQLAQLTDKHTQLEDTFAAKQLDWERLQQTMTDNVRKLELALGEAVARLRQLESQNAAERAVADELRAQQAVMAAKLAEYSKLSETLFSLSRLPH
ncbi:hypothetical protein IWW35_002463 [Coemansia sp. RSA 1878]|nr:hypothetical protein IWW35_002463 [Coemansia sp. RSA 1878]